MARLKASIFSFLIGFLMLSVNPLYAQIINITPENAPMEYSKLENKGLPRERIVSIMKKRVYDYWKDALTEAETETMWKEVLEKLPKEDKSKPEPIVHDTIKINNGGTIHIVDPVPQPDPTPEPTVLSSVKFEFVNHEIVSSKGRVLPANTVTAIERNISNLFTAMQKAYIEKRPVDLSDVKITDEAKLDVALYTDSIPTSFDKPRYENVALNDVHGNFEVRGFLVTFHPLDDTYKGSLKRELTATFTSDGTIIGVAVAMEAKSLSYRKHVFDNNVIETERLNTMRKFVENFRQYYEAKDIEKVRTMYNPNALIITGRVVEVMEKGNVGAFENVKVKQKKGKRVIYEKKDVNQYLAALEKVFKNNKYINLQFDSIQIERHPNPQLINYYAVTLRQTWITDKYSDEGYLFLLWYFDPEGKKSPQVYIRTWQPLDVPQNMRYGITDAELTLDKSK